MEDEQVQYAECHHGGIAIMQQCCIFVHNIQSALWRLTPFRRNTLLVRLSNICPLGGVRLFVVMYNNLAKFLWENIVRAYVIGSNQLLMTTLLSLFRCFAATSHAVRVTGSRILCPAILAVLFIHLILPLPGAAGPVVSDIDDLQAAVNNLTSQVNDIRNIQERLSRQLAQLTNWTSSFNTSYVTLEVDSSVKKLGALLCVISHSQ